MIIRERIIIVCSDFEKIQIKFIKENVMEDRNCVICTRVIMNHNFFMKKKPSNKSPRGLKKLVKKFKIK